MVQIIKDEIKNDPPALTKPHVVVLLDESGSMSGQRDSVVSTFNEYVNSVRDTAATVSLYTFDCSGIREKMYMTPVADVKDITTEDYRPNGMTPLYDAMGKVMRKFEDVEGAVQFVTHTDGEENYSKEFDFKALDNFIKALTEKGWLFVYLAEGVEGSKEISKFSGVKMNFSSQNRIGTMRSLSMTTDMYASGAGNSASDYSNTADGVIDIDSRVNGGKV